MLRHGRPTQNTVLDNFRLLHSSGRVPSTSDASPHLHRGAPRTTNSITNCEWGDRSAAKAKSKGRGVRQKPGARSQNSKANLYPLYFILFRRHKFLLPAPYSPLPTPHSPPPLPAPYFSGYHCHRIGCENAGIVCWIEYRTICPKRLRITPPFLTVRARRHTF
jgi:hypothetical protein